MCDIELMSRKANVYSGRFLRFPRAASVDISNCNHVIIDDNRKQ